MQLDDSMLLTVSLNQMRNHLPGIALAAVAAGNVVGMNRISVHWGSAAGTFHRGYLQNQDAKLYENDRTSMIYRTKHRRHNNPLSALVAQLNITLGE